MADVTGPISSLPGSTHHSLPEGAVCDDHPDRLAVVRLQGETDSMGCEMHDLCQECLEQYRHEIREERAKLRRCDWCKNETTDCRETRDHDEGMCGPVYDVCAACRKRRDDREREELEQYDFGDYDEPDDPGDDCGRWLNGRLDASCRLAGTEFCDWECPFSRSRGR